MNAWQRNESNKRAVDGAYTHFGISEKPDNSDHYFLSKSEEIEELIRIK